MTMGAALRAAAWAAGVTLLLGCEYRSLRLDGEDAARATAPARIVDAGAARDTAAGEAGGGGPGVRWTRPRDQCDPVAQDCGGASCGPDCQQVVYACRGRAASARGTQGYLCSGDDDCAPGFACVQQLSTQRCARYCRDNRECETGTRCVDATLRCDQRDPTRNMPRYLCTLR